MKLLGMADLVARWVYTKKGVHKLARCADFPAPCGVVNQGRTKLWRLENVEFYEQLHPEVLSENRKTQKMFGYYLARIRDRKGMSAS